MPSRGKDSYSIQSVDNALDVLEALCEEEDEVRISRLSERLGMNKTSVFRLLATFENRGYVEREESSGKYRLGISAYEIGQKFLSRNTLLRKARPVMERLVRECNESIYLVVRRGEEVLFLDQVDTAQQVKIVSLVGKRYPVADTCAGKLMLAHGDPAENGSQIAKADLLKFQQQGYCFDTGRLGDGIASIAVPVFSTNDKLAGTLCFVGPDFRLPREKIIEEFLPRLKEAGEIVSSKLGFLGHYLGKELF